MAPFDQRQSSRSFVLLAGREVGDIGGLGPSVVHSLIKHSEALLKLHVVTEE